MVWHFFRKDVRLLWPLALAVVLTQALCAVRTSMLGYFDQPPVLERLTAFLPLLVYLGLAVAAITVVQQEPLSGLREDWLIRPIRRRDLALSKVLWMLLMVHLPIALVDVVEQLTLHFPPSVSIGVALCRSFVLLFAISLPALLLGAVTRSLTEALLFGIAAAIGIEFMFAVVTSAMSPALFEIGGQSGMTWISESAAALVMLLGGAATLAFQYSTRRTSAARVLGLATVLFALCTFLCLPKATVVAFQEALWGHVGSSEIKLTFDTSRQPSPSAPRMALSYVNVSPAPAAVIAAREAEKARIDRQMTTIRVPLSIGAMHPGDILIADRVVVRLTDTTGRVLYQGAGVCTRGGTGVGISCSDNGLEVWASAVQSGNIQTEQRVNLPIRDFEQIEDEPVSMKVSYVLTRLVPRSTRTLNAIGDRLLLPEMGSCATRIDADADDVELGCLTNVGVPSCAAAVLEDPQTQQHNPELHACGLNYGPFHRVGLEAAVSQSRLSMPFRDRTGLVHYPVGSTAINRARILLTVYDPIDHFHDTVALPNMRLREWQIPD